MEKMAHILVLDDDEGILQLAKRLLERAGHRVSVAPTAAAARVVVEADAPDLLILDYRLGAGETGLDFFRGLRKSGLMTPAIMVTGFTDEAKIIEALRTGVADVVPKGGEYLEYLPDAVKRVLNQAIMEEKLAEAELVKAREAHYRTMSEVLPQLVWTCTPDGKCDFLSKQWEEYTGKSEQEQLGLGWLEAVHADDRSGTMDAWMKAVAGVADYDVEFRIQRKDGEWRWFKSRAVPMRDEKGTILKWFGTCTDVHDQREAFEERERLLMAEKKARREAEEANRAKDRFLAMLSHELRTPLTPVLAVVKLLEESAELPAALMDDARMLRRNVELEARLIDDLLDLTRVAKGKLQLSRETVDVHAAIAAVLEICAGDIEAKALRITVRPAAARHHVSADYARLQQMLWNLLKNAAKFSPQGGAIEIHTMDADGGRMRIEVKDQGIGIEAEQLARVFMAFEQGGDSVTRQFGGLGLGLAITKALAELHGGSVAAASEGAGKGATFTIELPTVEAGAAMESTVNGTKAHLARALRILLVEDHLDTANVMTRLMRRQGHEVVMVGTVAAAKAAWPAGEFDLLMSDVGLPDGTGLDLVRWVRETGSMTPAIALTGFGMEEDVQRCLDAGFNAHLTKPVDFTRLEKLVAEVGSGVRV